MEDTNILTNSKAVEKETRDPFLADIKALLLLMLLKGVWRLSIFFLRTDLDTYFTNSLSPR